MPSGRLRNYTDPKEIADLFEQYVEYCKNNPILRHDFVGKDAKEVYRYVERPLTIEGFKVFCRKNAGEVHDYLNNTDGKYQIFSTICRAIKEEIRKDQIEGGMAGIYNPSITQRLNNLVEKTAESEKPGYTIPQITIKYETNDTGTGSTGTAQSTTDSE